MDSASGVKSCDRNPFGINGPLNNLPPSAYTLAKDAHYGWVRLFFRWDKMQAAPFGPINTAAMMGPDDHPAWQSTANQMILDAEAAHFSILVTINGRPSWADATNVAEMYGDFMDKLVARFSGDVHAGEIWNQPNFEYAPAIYRSILARGAASIHAHDPNGARVLAPGIYEGPACNQNETLSDWLVNGDGTLAAAFDTVSIHPYNSDANVIRNRIVDASNFAVAHGIGQVWVSESGFGPEGTGCGDGNGCLASVPAVNIGACINLVSEMMRPTSPTYVPRFARWFVFKLADRDDNTACSPGLLDANGNPKGRYNEVKAYNLSTGTWWQ